MIDFLKGWVLNIISLVVFLVLLEILVPSGKIKKLVDLISGIILVIAIISPLLNLVNKKIDFKEFQLKAGNFLDKIEIEENARNLNEMQMKQISETYRQKLIDELEDIGETIDGVSDAKADVIINEDYTSKNFGEIKRVYLTLKLKKGNNGVKPITKIEKVEVGGERKPARGVPGPAADLAIRLAEDKVNKMFNVKKEDIVISVP